MKTIIAIHFKYLCNQIILTELVAMLQPPIKCETKPWVSVICLLLVIVT